MCIVATNGNRSHRKRANRKMRQAVFPIPSDHSAWLLYYFFHFYFVVCDSKNRNRNFRFISIGNSDVFAVYAAGWWLSVTGWQIQNALACYISRFGIWQYYNFDDPNIKCYIKGLWSFTRVNTSWWKQSHFHIQNIECRTVIYDRSISACHRCQHKRNTALKNGKQQTS